MIKTVNEIIKSTNWDKVFEDSQVRFFFREMINNAKNYKDKNKAIRYLYKYFTPKILDQHKSNPKLQVDVFRDIFLLNLTPIEYIAYCCIRYRPNIIMYPQYPFKGYFMDFANPSLKINIELDGKDFHNKGKDLIRDNEIKKEGWKIFRIPGYKCYKSVNFEGVEEISDSEWSFYFCQTIDGIIEAISKKYFSTDYDEIYDKKYYHINNSIEEHLQ